MKQSGEDIRERFCEVLQLYNNAIKGNKVEEAYHYILLLCQSTNFKHTVLTNNLFNTLAQLQRYEDAYTYAKNICSDFLEKGNLNQILYNYQTLMFFKKKLSNPPHDTLQRQIKAYLYEQASHLKKKYNLFPQAQYDGHKKINIGHIIGLVSPGHAPTKMLLNELWNIDHTQFSMHIFTSEWATNWLFSAQKPEQLQSHYDDLNDMIQRQLKTKLFIPDISNDFLTRCIHMCKNILQNEIDILVVNATDAEAITLMVAMIKPAPYMLNAVHGGPMLVDNFDGIIQLQKDDFIHDTQIPQHYIAITSDIQFDPSDVSEPLAKHAFEELNRIKEKYILTGTFGSLFKVDNEQYIHTIGTFLQEHPNVFHVFIGWGNSDELRKKFERYSVTDRIKHFRFQKNIKPFMEILDVYLASFPYPGHTCELECMALGKPVVSMAWTEGHHFNSGARIVGLSECIAPQNDCVRYKQIAHAFITDSILQKEIGTKLCERFNKEFSPLVRTQKIEGLYKHLMTTKSKVKG